MAATAVTGKRFTFTHGGKDGSAQITSASVDQSASSETIQTLAGSVAISQGVESTLSLDFLYDGDKAGGFYAALQSALTAGTAGAFALTGGSGDKFDGQAIVTSLSTEVPADGAVTCSAELTVSGDLGFTGAAPAAQAK